MGLNDRIREVIMEKKKIPPSLVVLISVLTSEHTTSTIDQMG